MANTVKVLLCALALAASIVGCWEAEPDGDTMADLRDSVAAFPLEVKTALAKWAANRVAFGYVTAHGEGRIGSIECVSLRDMKSKKFVQINLRTMLQCLQSMQTSTYVECLEHIRVNTEQEVEDDDYGQCKWSTYTKDFAPHEIPNEAHADRAMHGDMTWVLIGLPPPPVEIQIMILGLPGMLGPRGALCPQGVNWACAPNPFDAEPGTSSAATGGGDR